MPNLQIFNKKWVLYCLLLIAVLVNLLGLLTPVWGVDATLYASISKTMVVNNNYLELFSKGKDWLDKPHFPFWVVAIFFKVFGFTAWAYKLPAIIFVVGGAYYTYLLAKILHNKQVGYWAALILLTAQHIVISNNDVRAEPYLTGLIIASIYHFYIAYRNNNYGHLVVACIFTAFAIMTKGVFAIIPIGAAIFGELIIKKKWQSIFNWRWVWAILLIAIFILPEIYCLYIQFDSHPEKLIFNTRNVSGIKFFFWDSQFGRFFNTGPIKGSGDPTFFLHTILWAFLPWAVLWYLAIFNFIKKFGRNVKQTEWLCISASFVMLFIFSASKFQLPHYINILLPFFAITTAQYVNGLSHQKSIKQLQIVQYVVTSLMLFILLMLNYFYKPQNFYGLYFFIIILLFIALFFTLKQKLYTVKKLFISSILVSFIVNVYFSLAFYPSLVKYESGTQIGFYINQYYPKTYIIYTSRNDNSDALMFSLNNHLRFVDFKQSAPAIKKPYLFVGFTADVDSLKNQGLKIKEIKNFPDYHITLLTGGFINNKTRKNNLGFKQLVLVY